MASAPRAHIAVTSPKPGGDAAVAVVATPRVRRHAVPPAIIATDGARDDASSSRASWSTGARGAVRVVGTYDVSSYSSASAFPSASASTPTPRRNAVASAGPRARDAATSRAPVQSVAADPKRPKTTTPRGASESGAGSIAVTSRTPVGRETTSPSTASPVSASTTIGAPTRAPTPSPRAVSDSVAANRRHAEGADERGAVGGDARLVPDGVFVSGSQIQRVGAWNSGLRIARTTGASPSARADATTKTRSPATKKKRASRSAASLGGGSTSRALGPSASACSIRDTLKSGDERRSGDPRRTSPKYASTRVGNRSRRERSSRRFRGSESSPTRPSSSTFSAATRSTCSIATSTEWFASTASRVSVPEPSFVSESFAGDDATRTTSADASGARGANVASIATCPENSTGVPADSKSPGAPPGTGWKTVTCAAPGRVSANRRSRGSTTSRPRSRARPGGPRRSWRTGRKRESASSKRTMERLPESESAARRSTAAPSEGSARRSVRVPWRCCA